MRSPLVFSRFRRENLAAELANYPTRKRTRPTNRVTKRKHPSIGRSSDPAFSNILLKLHDPRCSIIIPAPPGVRTARKLSVFNHPSPKQRVFPMNPATNAVKGVPPLKFRVSVCSSNVARIWYQSFSGEYILLRYTESMHRTRTNP